MKKYRYVTKLGYAGEKFSFPLFSLLFLCFLGDSHYLSSIEQAGSMNFYLANYNFLFSLIGVTRFELAAPASRRQCSTRLSYTPFIFRARADNALIFSCNNKFRKILQRLAIGRFGNMS